MELFREQVKQVLRKYIREQLDKTVAGGKNLATTSQPQQQQDLEQVLLGLQATFQNMDKRKLQQSKKDPRFKSSIAEIGNLVAELQGLLQPLN